MNRQVQPALVIGLDEPGARVAARAAALAEEHLAGIGAIKTLAVVESATSVRAAIPTTRLTCIPDGLDVHPLRESIPLMLEPLYHFDLRQAARARGWEIRREAGVAVILMMPAHQIGRLAPAALEVLETLAMRYASRPFIVTGLVLCEDDCQLPDTGWTFPALMENVFLLAPINACGLSWEDSSAWETMAARWILEMLCTPLGAQVAALPLASPHTWASFGLAQWRFPAEALADHLSRRLQCAMLDALQAFTDESGTAFTSQLREKCTPPPLYPSDAAPGLGGGFVELTHPTLARIARLPDDIAEVAAAATARLNEATHAEDSRLDAALREAIEVLQRLCAESLNSGGAGRLSALDRQLDAAVSMCRQTARESEAQGALWTQRLNEEQARCTACAEFLAEACADFPPWTWRVGWQILRHPWRWPALIRQYRDIEVKAVASLDSHAARLRLAAQIQETMWQAAYYSSLAVYVAEQQSEFQAFRTALVQARDDLAPVADGEVNRDLESAALPPALVDHFYGRSVGSPDSEWATFVAQHGSLAFWALTENGALGLLDTLSDYARERLDFLAEIHLDELLVHTYSGADLRARLTELMEAAAPFWNWDYATLDDVRREQVRQIAWVGVAHADTTLLADLLPERGVTLYSTGECGVITAVQMVFGLPAQGEKVRVRRKT